MSIRTNRFPIPRVIVPQHILASVHDDDKPHLPSLITGILEINPNATFYSTGGTGKVLVQALGEERAKKQYIPVERFTGVPEMEGGLVKTLVPGIHAGILGERGNPTHIEYLTEILPREEAERLVQTWGEIIKELQRDFQFSTSQINEVGLLERLQIGLTRPPFVYFDLLINSFYPFERTLEQEGTTAEDARANTDIGGPSMVTGAAKNWHSIAVLTDNSQYERFLEEVRTNRGIPIELRFELAREATRRVADYREAIAGHMKGLTLEKALEGLTIQD
ncbi:MAG: hypothetical protein HYS32_04380 [Candidatus Woesearchaeota archaeon]|nr:MAG: hypothetical protein HYS32_04380 [Candidatus Woesearchaeota archaeon]